MHRFILIVIILFAFSCNSVDERIDDNQQDNVNITEGKYFMLCFLNQNNFSNNLRPVIDTLQMHFKDNVRFELIDTDRQPELTDSFDVQYAPTMIILSPSKKELHRIIGYNPYNLILKKLKRRDLLQF